MPETNHFASIAISRLGVDPTNLGCVMLDVVLPPIYKRSLDPNWAYHSSVHKHVNGYEGTEHVTLLYGLLNSPNTDRDLIDGVLEGWVKPDRLLFDAVDCFESNDGVAEYGAIVLKPTGRFQEVASLHDANVRLGKLPHVRPFPDYNPHITVGYVQKACIASAMAALINIPSRPIAALELNYGDK